MTVCKEQNRKKYIET